MNGDPTPKWTPGREAWLGKLAGGPMRPHGSSEGATATYCRALGWATRDEADPRGRDTITDAGRDVLVTWRGGERSAARHLDARPPRAAPFEVRIGFAMRGESVATLAEWLVFTGQAREAMTALATALDRAAAASRSLATVLPPPAPEPAPARPSERVGMTLAPSLGTPVTGPAYLPCEACHGLGRTGRHWLCRSCKGTGKVKRTVTP